MHRHLPTPNIIRRAALLAGGLLLCAGGAAAASSHGYLGVTLQDINSSMAKALQLEDGVGVLVLELVDDGPAEKAGLAEGDVVLAFDGEEINEDHTLTRAVRATEPGQTVKVEVQRDGRRRTIEVEMGEAKSNRRSFAWSSDGDGPDVRFYGEGEGDGNHVFVFPDGKGENVWFGDGEMKKLHLDALGIAANRGYLGVELGDLNEQLGEYFGVADGEGALVNAVRDDTPAAAAGLRAGDVIVAIDGDDIEDAGDVHAAMAEHEPGDEIEVAYVRKGDRGTTKITLAEMPEGSYSFRVGRAPRFEHHFAPDVDIAFPEGFDHDIHVVAPKGHGVNRRVLRIEDDDMDELRAELDKLRAELKDLKDDLKK